MSWSPHIFFHKKTTKKKNWIRYTKLSKCTDIHIVHKMQNTHNWIRTESVIDSTIYEHCLQFLWWMSLCDLTHFLHFLLLQHKIWHAKSNGKRSLWLGRNAMGALLLFTVFCVQWTVSTWTLPLFQIICDTVGQEMNRLFQIFLTRNATFNGEVSLAGHSLGEIC